METKPTFEEDLASIHRLMDRSVKFVSLSGLAGLLAGAYALAGAAAAYYAVYYPAPLGEANFFPVEDASAAKNLVVIAAAVLIASLATGLWLSARKARKANVSVWGDPGRRLLVNLGIPLLAGGFFCLILLSQGQIDLAATSTLIFYGLALVNASPNLFDEVRYLGLSEIGLGLASMLLPGYSLLFWAAGFGVLHILYGAILYRKYE
jgi:hypothetical protein